MMYDKIFSKMVELREFTFESLWEQIKYIEGSKLEKLSTMDKLMQSSLVERHFGTYIVRT